MKPLNLSTDPPLERIGAAPPCERCEMCGRSSARHGVVLVTDDCPLYAGARGEVGRTSTVCRDCKVGMRSYLRALGIRPETLRRVSSFPCVHARIGELLKSFGIGKRVPSSAISIVADQPAWRSRLRELRQPPFGWGIRAQRRMDRSGRVRCDYILLEEKPWPEMARRVEK